MTTEVYYGMLNKDDDSPEKCRERRRRRIEMRRLSSLSTRSPMEPAANSLSEGADQVDDTTREGKRSRPSEGVVRLTSSSSSPSGDEADRLLPAASAERLEGEPVYGMMSVTGRSREMEDAVGVRTPLCHPEITRGRPVHFFGVFDGHGGSHVAALLSLKMHVLLEEELMGVKPMEENGDGCGSSTSTKRMREEGSDGGGEEIWGDKSRDAIRRAFQKADEMAVAMCPCGSMGSGCSCHPMEVALGGSTAVVALLSPDHIVLGNCGDSRAVLCRDGRAIPLTRDHKPDRSDELARIKALGGRVIFLNGARVEGILAMSRAIGDKYLKPYVTAEPETAIVRRDPKDEFLIIASDGLWDVLTNELACEIASRCLQEGSPPPSIGLNSETKPEDETGQAFYLSRSALAAALLTRLALARKSLDNISVIVVDLKRG